MQQGGDDLKAARETITAARTNIGQAERVLSMMQDNYRFGAATTLDIVDAQTARYRGSYESLERVARLLRSPARICFGRWENAHGNSHDKYSESLLRDL